MFKVRTRNMQCKQTVSCFCFDTSEDHVRAYDGKRIMGGGRNGMGDRDTLEAAEQRVNSSIRKMKEIVKLTQQDP